MRAGCLREEETTGKNGQKRAPWDYLEKVPDQRDREGIGREDHVR